MLLKQTFDACIGSRVRDVGKTTKESDLSNVGQCLQGAAEIAIHDEDVARFISEYFTNLQASGSSRTLSQSLSYELSGNKQFVWHGSPCLKINRPTTDFAIR